MAKKDTVPDEQKIFKLFHGHYNVHDFAGNSIRLDTTIAWAVNSRLKKGQVKDIIYDKDLDSFMVVIDSCNRTLKLDPKRCMVLHG
jgi:hypothetical protein